jgi:hypothetical protein
MTDETFTAIHETIGDALDDAENYLDDGDPEIDYGDEWPLTACNKAKRFGLVADWLKEQNGWFGVISRLEALAEAYRASAKEYAEEEEEEEE